MLLASDLSASIPRAGLLASPLPRVEAGPIESASGPEPASRASRPDRFWKGAVREVCEGIDRPGRGGARVGGFSRAIAGRDQPVVTRHQRVSVRAGYMATGRHNGNGGMGYGFDSRT